MSGKNDLIYGIRTVMEVVKSGKHLERVFVQKNLKGDLYKALMLDLHKSHTPISKVPVARIHRFTTKNHQGVVGLISPIQYHTLEYIVPDLFEQGKNPLILVLDEITDVRNFGAIARTAECMGVHALVIPVRGSAQVNEDAVKTSAGAFNYLPVCREADLEQAVLFLKNSGFSIIACTEKGRKLFADVDYSIPTVIILGSEEKGISDKLLAISDHRVKVSTTGQIASLNVSIAAGMALYEARRQRRSR